MLYWLDLYSLTSSCYQCSLFINGNTIMIRNPAFWAYQSLIHTKRKGEFWVLHQWRIDFFPQPCLVSECQINALIQCSLIYVAYEKWVIWLFISMCMEANIIKPWFVTRKGWRYCVNLSNIGWFDDDILIKLEGHTEITVVYRRNKVNAESLL